MLAKYNLLFTKKSLIILYAFGASFGLIILAVSLMQVLHAYASGTGFDVAAESFYLSQFILFVPYHIINGYLLRLLLERWRVNRHAAQAFHIAEYNAPRGLTPAHAGLLVDNDIRTEEIVATLYDLRERGVVTITDASVTLRTTDAPVSNAENQLLSRLFSQGAHFHLQPSNARLFLDASHAFRIALAAEMTQNGLLPPKKSGDKAKRVLLKIAFSVFSYVSVVFVIFLLSNPSMLLEVQYPRYDMEIGQPITEIVVALMVIGIALSGLSTPLLTKDGKATWRFAAGYRMYIRTVFKGKFEYNNPIFMSKEQQSVLPYAIAFSIEKRPVQDFVRLLNL